MKKCHRVVIILSNEYVRDNWSVFQLQQGFITMIESGSKMVFVLVPGMKEYINQHADTDDTYRMIKRATKINYAITWPCKSCCGDRFKLEMQRAMPKLRRGESRVGNGNHPNGVDRVLSNTTAFTDISNGPEPSSV
uniref:Single Ig IL-1-related receptor-like n=1 Tax=Phallusia mammillata TaxID=59560 RepID=A0A6F9DSG9_9ASCI|nr:single Ig IL-1-related receptor-like [Phallusia mammillata]